MIYGKGLTSGPAMIIAALICANILIALGFSLVAVATD
jgi:hypothetical protein